MTEFDEVALRIFIAFAGDVSGEDSSVTPEQLAWVAYKWARAFVTVRDKINAPHRAISLEG